MPSIFGGSSEVLVQIFPKYVKSLVDRVSNIHCVYCHVILIIVFVLPLKPAILEFELISQALLGSKWHQDEYYGIDNICKCYMGFMCSGTGV